MKNSLCMILAAFFSVCQYLSCLVWHQTPVDGAYHLAGFVLSNAGSSYEMASG
jgi:hypothetical protein